MNYRNELKIRINQADLFELRPRLKAVLKSDPNTVDGKYKIRSLYFDTPEDKALMEKIDGHNNREKFRLRYYNNNSDRIRLEKKSKIKGLTKKEGVELTKDQAIKILNGEYDFIRETNEPLLLDFYHKVRTNGLRPKSIVDYIREPYIFKAGNVRITIDSDIRAIAFNPQSSSDIFFDSSAPTVPLEPGQILMEVKWDEFLPNIIKDLIQLGTRSSGAFSKYALSRRLF